MEKILLDKLLRIASNMTLVILAIVAYGLIVYAWGYFEQFR